MFPTHAAPGTQRLQSVFALHMCLHCSGGLTAVHVHCTEQCMGAVGEACRRVHGHGVFPRCCCKCAPQCACCMPYSAALQSGRECWGLAESAGAFTLYSVVASFSAGSSSGTPLQSLMILTPAFPCMRNCWAVTWLSGGTATPSSGGVYLWYLCIALHVEFTDNQIGQALHAA